MPNLTKREDGKLTITWQAYRALHRDFRNTWTTVRADIPNYRDLLGRRTCMTYDNGTCLVIEGKGFVIDGAPRAHRLMLDPKYREGDVYILEFLNDDGGWQVLCHRTSLEGARALLQAGTPHMRRGETKWTFTYVEIAGEG